MVTGWQTDLKKKLRTGKSENGVTIAIPFRFSHHSIKSTVSLNTSFLTQGD